MKQLSFEDIIESRRPSIGDLVEVTEPRDNDVESKYYFDIYKGKKGVLIDIHKGKEVCFEVEFEGLRNGLFYESEVKKITNQGGNRNGGKTKRKTKGKSARTKRKVKGT